MQSGPGSNPGAGTSAILVSGLVVAHEHQRSAASFVLTMPVPSIRVCSCGVVGPSFGHRRVLVSVYPGAARAGFIIDDLAGEDVRIALLGVKGCLGQWLMIMNLTSLCGIAFFCALQSGPQTHCSPIVYGPRAAAILSVYGGAVRAG